MEEHVSSCEKMNNKEIERVEYMSVFLVIELPHTVRYVCMHVACVCEHVCVCVCLCQSACPHLCVSTMPLCAHA